MSEDFYVYTVIFHQNVIDREYEPIIFGKPLSKTDVGRQNTLHLLDPDMYKILQALEYIIQLPRFKLDLLDLSEDIIDKALYEPHNVYVIPDSLKDINYHLWNGILSRSDGVFIADDVDISTINTNALLGVHRCAEISQKLLEDQWNQMFLSICNFCCDGFNALEYKPIYLHDRNLNILPLMFLARQYRQVDSVFYDLFHVSNIEIEKECNRMLYGLKLKQMIMMKLRSMIDQKYSESEVYDDNAKQFVKDNYDILKESMEKNCRISVVVTFPGISKHQRKISGFTAFLPIEEKRAIRIMGLHRAIATNSAFIELPIISDILYQYLDSIERELKKTEGTNNKYIWRMLKNIGREIKRQITDEQESVLLQAPYISVFSDFPLGLAILPGQQVPLSIISSISYQPITPLSRQIVSEMSQAGQLALYLNCRILFIECIPEDINNHMIHNISEVLYEQIKYSADGCANVSVYYEEAYTVKDLKFALNKYENGAIEILIISAHGFYTEQNNLAGLWIGNEKWMANDIDLRIPPIVLLSACHVSPRGRNVVNAADLLIRAGARVVLSAFIPVDVRRNTILFSRLFVYIFEAFKGSKQYKTLADAWTGVVASNAVNEIIESSSALKKWYCGDDVTDSSRLYQFMMHRSVRRLQNSNIYNDTITVLKEMLKEDGMEGKFDSILDNENYFPESIFYQMIGAPETILLTDEISLDNDYLTKEY